MNPTSATRPGPKGPRRQVMPVRVGEPGLAAIDQLATSAGLFKAGKPNRSEMARRLLAAAVTDPKIRKAVVTKELRESRKDSTG